MSRSVVGDIVEYIDKPRPLSWHLSTFSIVLGLPTLVLAAVLGFAYVNAEKIRIIDSADRWARDISFSIENELATVQTTLSILSKVQILRTGNIPAFMALIKSIKMTGDAWVVVRDSAGKVLMNSRQDLDTAVVPPDRLPLNDRGARGHVDNTVVSNLRFAELAKTWIISTATLINQNAEPGQPYTVQIAIRSTRFLRLLTETTLPPGWIATLLDGDNIVIARTVNHEKAVGSPVTPELASYLGSLERGRIYNRDHMPNLEGEPTMASVYRLPTIGWSVVVMATPAVYRFPLYQAVTLGLTGLILILGVTTIMARLMARRLLKPISTLHQKSEALKRETVVDLPMTIVAEINEAMVTMRQAAVGILSRARNHELLLKELNHRVKNSLQNVSSVLRLQLSRVPASCRPSLQEAALRVAAIGRVHEGLYDAANPTISSQFINRLLDDISQALPIDLDSHVLDITLDLDLAVPLSLFLHEAVSNAVKYGTVDDHSVRFTAVRVVFQHGVDTEQWTLEIRDYGSGFPEGLTQSNVKTLGFKLMKNLAVQLNGSLEMRNPPEGGAVVSISGPVRLPRIKS